MPREDRKKRIQELRRSSDNILDKPNRWYINRQEEKVGRGYNNIVFSPGTMESNNEATGDPGFKFAVEGSNLRCGKHLGMNIHVNDIQFDGGNYTFNPIIRFLPPNVVTFYRVIIPLLPFDDIKGMAGAFNGVLGILQNLGL